MNWINGFEVMCYIITCLFIFDVLHRRDFAEIRLFASAALAGYALELMAVRVTDIYHYSDLFFISIGFRPYQFPFFGGLMWGGLTVYAVRIAKRIGRGALMTSLVSGWLIVTMDLFLDVVAIRLNGGFWTWDGREINLVIDQHMFMSVIWVNFLGYMFETPAIVYAFLKEREHPGTDSLSRKLLGILKVSLIGVAFVGVASLAALLLNSVTDEYFAFVAFSALWMAVLLIIIKDVVKRLDLRGGFTFDIPLIVYWDSMYAFCLAALHFLHIDAVYPWYMALGVVLGCLTVSLSGCSFRTE